MLKSLRNALKIKDIRDRLLFTFLMLVVVRFGSNLPIPGVNTEYLKNFFEQQRQNTGNAFGFFNAITGGSFEQMSVLALSITPYITSSIIMELMTIAIPKLEELQREGEDGRRKMMSYTRYLTVCLALIESIAMAVGFGSQGLLYNFNVKSVLVAVAAMTAGSAFLMWIGERITDKGVGNGISIVLLINIISSLPNDLGSLVERFILNSRSVATAVVAGLIILTCILLMVVFVVLLCDAERRIPVQYTQKIQGRRMMGGSQSSVIPLKVNTAGDPGDLRQLPAVLPHCHRTVLHRRLYVDRRKNPDGAELLQLVPSGPAGLFHRHGDLHRADLSVRLLLYVDYL